MALDLLSLLVVLGLSSAAPDLIRLREFGWLRDWADWLHGINQPNGFWRSGGGLVLTLGLPVLAVALLQALLAPALSGALGFVFGVVVLFWSFGPRDLDQDVSDFVDGHDPEARAAAARALEIEASPVQVTADAVAELAMDAPAPVFNRAVDAIFEAALKRWFGVIFWFLVFGAAGAALYRLAQLIADRRELKESLPARQIEWAERLWAALAFIPAHLMSLSLALASDFDSVVRAWREHHERHGQGWLHLDLGFLTAAARALVDADDLDPVLDAHGNGSALAARQAQQLVWRVLIAWLAAMALVVLLGWT